MNAPLPLNPRLGYLRRAYLDARDECRRYRALGDARMVGFCAARCGYYLRRMRA